MLLLAASAAALLSWNSSLLKTVPLWPSSTSLRANSLFCRETGTEQRGASQGDGKQPASKADKYKSLSVWSFSVMHCWSCDLSYWPSYPSKNTFRSVSLLVFNFKMCDCFFGFFFLMPVVKKQITEFTI